MKTIQLDGQWTLNVVENEETPAEARNLPQDIPLRIPGDLATALLDRSLIDDPYYARNELDVLWIGKTDWSLKRSFLLDGAEIPQSPECLSFIEFESLDTVAEVYLNGTEIGKGRNMFRRHRFDVAAHLREGENLLEVIIRSPENFTRDAAAGLPYPVPHSAQFPWQWNHRNLLRKVACHGGWDWGITLMTGGIYEIPTLFLGVEGTVRHLTLTPLPVENSDDWTVDIHCEYESAVDGMISLVVDLEGRRENLTLPVTAGSNLLEYRMTVPSPELWWPAGQGGQRLYSLNLSVGEENFRRKIGFRTVEVVVEDDSVGRSMFFRVNGRDIFAKGANWIPVDAFPSRHTDEAYRRLLTDARDANMNMIRLWGGGQYEKDIFYRLCDELGLMIWHDMMFACSLFPSDADFLGEADAEIRYQVKRLQSHPSIVLWCGNNEDLGAISWFPESRAEPSRYLVDYDRLNEGVVGRAVRETDPHRTWWPSSPSAGEGDYSDCWHDDSKGDMHYWSVWHEGLPFESYYDVTPRFCSEFGFQSFPGERTVASYAPEKARNLTSPVMRHHQKNNAGNSIILSTMARYFRMPGSLGDQLYLSQVQQARAIRTAVDYWRARRPVAMGALYWQLNDNWPVASWSSIEYDGSWKLLHYEARRFFAPRRICLYIKDDQLHLVMVNDNPEPVSGGLSLYLSGFDGSILQTEEWSDINCPAGGIAEVAVLPLDGLAAQGSRSWNDGPRPHDADRSDVVDERFTDRFVFAEWKSSDDPGCPVDCESLLLTLPRDCELADAAIRVRAGSDPGSLVLESDRPAFYVQAEVPASGRFDDAGFTLLPGRPVELRWIPGETGNTPSDLPDITVVRHLRTTY